MSIPGVEAMAGGAQGATVGATCGCRAAGFAHGLAVMPPLALLATGAGAAAGGAAAGVGSAVGNGAPPLVIRRGEPRGTVPATRRSSMARPTESFHARKTCARIASRSCLHVPREATASKLEPPAHGLPPVASAARAGSERGTSASQRAR